MFEFRKAKYSADNSLAIVVYEDGEPYSKLTVCSYPDVDVKKFNEDSGFKGAYYQFVDVNAFGNDKIIEQLENEDKIYKVPNIYWTPGYVEYPLYEFKKEWIDNLKED